MFWVAVAGGVVREREREREARAIRDGRDRREKAFFFNLIIIRIATVEPYI
jgi:hypothetical protein